MAHFAEIDESSTVIRVLAVPDDQEHRGQEFLADDLGLGGTWIQTSYNTNGNVHGLGGTPARYNFAGPGFTWDPVAEAFYGPQPFPSWSLDENYVWQAPVPYPGGVIYGLPLHYWDDDATQWVEIEAEAS